MYMLGMFGKLRYRSVTREDDGNLHLRFSNAATRDQARQVLKSSYNDFLMEAIDKDDKYYLVAGLNNTSVREIENYAVNQNLTTLRNRVNELGVAEPLVQRQGRNRIVVQLPGVQDAAAAKRILGATANLEFRLEAASDASAFSVESQTFRANPTRKAKLEKDIIVTGSSVANAQSSFDENGMPQVNIDLDTQGGKLMHRVTRHAVKRRMAVVFVEHKSHTKVQQVDGELVTVRQPYVEKSIISLATAAITSSSAYSVLANLATHFSYCLGSRSDLGSIAAKKPCRNAEWAGCKKTASGPSQK